MGASHSSEFNLDYDLTNNDSLLLFVGELKISPNDAFWDTFLTFNLKPLNREYDELITKRLQSVYKALSVNNLSTNHFAILLSYISANASRQILCPEDVQANAGINAQRRRFYNALYTIRSFSKYLVENISEDEYLHHFKLIGEGNEEELMNLELYLGVLIRFLIEMPVTDGTYNLHLEVVNSLLVLLSGPMLHSAAQADKFIAYKYMMESKEAPSLLKMLLQRYVEQMKPPPQNGGIFNGLSSLWNYLTFSTVEEVENEAPLANHAVLLLLVLVNHCSTTNPYRKGISLYTANVNGVYDTLCNTIKSEENTLLLYHLLHTNVNFKNYVCTRTDVELMLVPILKRIYDIVDKNGDQVVAERSCRHMYMSLIILLILTEDQLLNKSIHTLILKNVTWYTQKPFAEISLGGLVILIIVRTIQYNLLRMRDKYLHSNCLASLANMSSQFHNLHPYVCQRLISLLEILSKTMSKENMDVSVVENAIRMILEVVDSCLWHQLQHNTNLVYALLYNKEVFKPFRNHQSFHDIMQNIDLVLTYFSKKLEKEEEDCIEVEEVMKKVQKFSLQWPKNLLKKFPELKYKYVEEEKPEEFFIPYVWSMVGQFSGIYWDQSVYKL